MTPAVVERAELVDDVLHALRLPLNELVLLHVRLHASRVVRHLCALSGVAVHLHLAKVHAEHERDGRAQYRVAHDVVVVRVHRLGVAKDLRRAISFPAVELHLLELVAEEHLLRSEEPSVFRVVHGSFQRRIRVRAAAERTAAVPAVCRAVEVARFGATAVCVLVRECDGRKVT